MTPCPRFAGKIKAKYFQLASLNAKSRIKVLPKTIKAEPRRTSGINLPQRDIVIPATNEPIGVASDGIARRAPAFDADSRRITWKKSGSMKRN